jgi:hypothetical protein
MGAVQCEMLRHDVAVADEMALFEGDGPEVMVDGAQDPGQPAAALRTGRVVDHVDGDELVEEGVVACLLASEHLLDDRPRAASIHAGKRPIATAVPVGDSATLSALAPDCP